MCGQPSVLGGYDKGVCDEGTNAAAGLELHTGRIPHHEMRIRGYDDQPGLGVEPGRRPPERRQQQQRHQERREDVDGDGALVALGQRALRRDQGHAGVLHHHVHALQLASLAAELPDAVEAAQVQRPDLDDVLGPGPGYLPDDVGLGLRALLRAAAGHDHLGRVEADKVSRCLEAQPDVGPRHDDRLAREVILGIRQAAELVAKESEEEIAGGGGGSQLPRTSFVHGCGFLFSRFWVESIRGTHRSMAMMSVRSHVNGPGGRLESPLSAMDGMELCVQSVKVLACVGRTV